MNYYFTIQTPQTTIVSAMTINSNQESLTQLEKIFEDINNTSYLTFQNKYHEQVYLPKGIIQNSIFTIVIEK